MITFAALGLVLRAPPPRLLAEISEEKLELSVTPTRKLWLAEGSRWPGSQTTVAEHMTPSVLTVSPDATLKEAAMLINAQRITGLAVVEAGRLAAAKWSTDNPNNNDDDGNATNGNSTSWR